VEQSDVLAETEQQEAVVGVGDAERFLPVDGGGSGGYGVLEPVGGEYEHLTAWGHFECGGPAGGFHLVDGAEGYGIVELVCRHGFDTLGPDFGVEVEGADGLTKEGGFAVLGFGQHDAELRMGEGNGNAGKAATGAKVEECAGGRGDAPGAEEAVREVAGDDFAGFADGGEVGAGIPLEQKRQVGGKLVCKFGGDGESELG
jgi:hypothetical protein